MKFNRPSREIQLGSTLDIVVVGGMFQLAQAMIFRPWKDVETLLEEQHCILVQIDPRWR